jgi:hypothetical protein
LIIRPLLLVDHAPPKILSAHFLFNRNRFSSDTDQVLFKIKGKEKAIFLFSHIIQLVCLSVRKRDTLCAAL